MTNHEYRDLLTALGLTQAGAARLLGVDERTSRRWAAGERDIPPPAARFLRFLLEAKISPDRVLKLLSLCS
jgi:DNA-binding transcriptional regulator YiaG